MSTVIRVENLSKYYRLGLIGGGTFREEFGRWWARRLGRPDPWARIGQTDHSNREGDHIWALRDVRFEVKEGKILGIIGRNGGGESTLPKILSKITALTEGRMKIRGQVGSLLEGGAAFIPSLQGARISRFHVGFRVLPARLGAAPLPRWRRSSPGASQSRRGRRSYGN